MLVSTVRGVLRKLLKGLPHSKDERIATLDSREQVERELELPVLATYAPRKEG